MNILILILLSVAAGTVCFGLGSLIGNAVGKSKKKQDDAKRNGNRHA